MASKIKWTNNGGPCDYGVSGTHRLTYWLRLGKEVHKITPATPSAYDGIMMALHRGGRVEAYERFCFGGAATKSGADSVATLEAFAPRISAALWEVSEGRRDIRHATTAEQRGAGGRRLYAAELAAMSLLQELKREHA